MYIWTDLCSILNKFQDKYLGVLSLQLFDQTCNSAKTPKTKKDRKCDSKKYQESKKDDAFDFEKHQDSKKMMHVSAKIQK